MPKIYVCYDNCNGDCSPPDIAFLKEEDAIKWVEDQKAIYVDYCEIDLV